MVESGEVESIGTAELVSGSETESVVSQDGIRWKPAGPELPQGNSRPL